MTHNQTSPTNEQELRYSDTAYDIALTCYHAGSMGQRGKTIHPGTVQEWTDRIQAYTNAEITKVLNRLDGNKETLYWWTGSGYDKTIAIDMRAIADERAKLRRDDE